MALETFTSISILMIISAIMGVLATKTRQPLVVAYIVSGVICGPWGLSVITDSSFLQELSHTGIALLLFIAGLSLHPRRFFKQLSRYISSTLITCLINALIVFLLAIFFRYSWQEAAWMGIALMFSSTLLFIKLMPRFTKEHQRVNSLCLSILIIQDIIAVVVLMSISLQQNPFGSWWGWLLLPLSGVAAFILTFSFERFVIRPLIITASGRYEETKMLTALAWCLSVALLFKTIGFSLEIGAFFAGITLSQNPEAKEIEKGLAFLRDFFLVIFFVALGTEIDFYLSRKLVFSVLIFSGVIVFLRPYIFQWVFKKWEKQEACCKESSIRLGQASEFGLLISLLAYQKQLISLQTSNLLQLIVIFTLILSSLHIFFAYTRHILSLYKRID